jgi:PAS domain S-box-containing protein
VRGGRPGAVVLALGYLIGWVALWKAAAALNVAAGVSLWYPPAGATFALLLSLGWRAIPLPVLASLLAGMDLWAGRDWSHYLLANTLHGLSYGLVAQALRRLAGGRWDFGHPVRVAWFLGGCLAGASLQAFLGLQTMVLAGLVPAADAVHAGLGWWIGDFIGLITVAPALLLFVAPWLRRALAGRRGAARAPGGSRATWLLRAAQAGVSLALLVAVFWLPTRLPGPDAYSLAALVLLLPLAWVAITGGVRAAVLAALLLDLGVVAMVALFGQQAHALGYQSAMIALAVAGLLMGALVQAWSGALARYRDLARVSNDLLWEVDDRGRLTRLNGSLHGGLPVGAALGAHWRHVLARGWAQPDRAALMSALRRRAPFHGLALAVGSGGGEPAWVTVSGLPRYDTHGEPAGYRGTCTDITARRQAEEAVGELNAELRQGLSDLRASHRELEAFSYSVSHDLRAPLRAMDGYASSLLEDYADRLDETGRGYLRRLRVNAQEMGALIDDLLMLSRVMRARVMRRPVDLASLARTIAADLRRAQPERRVELRVPTTLPVHGDPMLLEVALRHLLENAWKFTATRDTARIEVAAEERAGGRRYCVRDNGVGFDPVYADRLFTAFRRLHSPARFGGHGVGLAIVQRVVARHGGRAGAEGREGQGATFWFTLGGDGD